MLGMGNRTGLRTRSRAAAILVGAALAAASLVLASPAGASNQSVKFTTTPIYYGAVTIGTSSSGVSLVTNNSTQSLYFVSASPGTNKTGAEFHASQGTCTGALAVGAS